MPLQNHSQIEFDRLYISAPGLRRLLNISSTELHRARKAGRLPPGIDIEGSKGRIWLRSELALYLIAWRK